MTHKEEAEQILNQVAKNINTNVLSVAEISMYAVARSLMAILEELERINKNLETIETRL